MTDHLGYERHDPAGRGSGNSRNGHYPKTVSTEVGDVELRVPRDDAAVEVGQVTDEAIREANGHWAKHLQLHRTTDLRLRWLFKFSDETAPGEATRYPRVNGPPVADLTAYSHVSRPRRSSVSAGGGSMRFSSRAAADR
jgi:hypothetical protein